MLFSPRGVKKRGSEQSLNRLKASRTVSELLLSPDLRTDLRTVTFSRSWAPGSCRSGLSSLLVSAFLREKRRKVRNSSEGVNRV